MFSLRSAIAAGVHSGVFANAGIRMNSPLSHQAGSDLDRIVRHPVMRNVLRELSYVAKRGDGSHALNHTGQYLVALNANLLGRHPTLFAETAAMTGPEQSFGGLDVRITTTKLKALWVFDAQEEAKLDLAEREALFDAAIIRLADEICDEISGLAVLGMRYHAYVPVTSSGMYDTNTTTPAISFMSRYGLSPSCIA